MTKGRGNGRSVLVLGGAGYVGSHCVAALVDAGWAPVVLDNLTTGHRALLHPEAQFVEGDFGDRSLVAALLKQREIQAVMHFAASSLVGESVDAPLMYYRNNVSKTVELLDAMRDAEVRNFIFSSTAAVYGHPETVPITEAHPVRPTSPYGTTKAVIERLLAEVEAAHGIRHVSLRYFNAAGAHPRRAIGERHDPETHLIPSLMQAALGQRSSVQVFGLDWPTPDGSCVRDYVHVCDLASAHLLALERLDAGAPSATYNVGTGRGHSVLDVMETVARVTGLTIPFHEGPRRPGDPAVLVANADLIVRELGWRPELSRLDSIVESAWAWHRRAPGVSSGAPST